MEVNRWGVVAIASVVFDIDVGQTLEAMYPPTASLTASAQKSIAYLALPHSNRHDEGDTQFAFRCRSEDESTSSFLYGFVLFRQRKDAAKARGYFQKAIVIVTQTPFVGLYERVLRVVGPLYFQVGNPLLEALYDNVLQWPAPMADTTMILPVAGTFVSFVVPGMVPSIEASVPTRRWSIEQESFDVNADDMASHDEDDDELQQQHEAPDEAIVRNGKFTAPAPRVAPAPLFCDILKPKTLASRSSVGLFSSFEGLEACLWDLWQLAITGESVLMVAPSARVCSQAVLAFTSLIAPVAYHGDYRPYFALYEADFTSIAAVHDATKCLNFPTTVLGTTNPFFLKALRFWPNAVVFPFLDAASRPATPPTAKRAFGFLDAADAAEVDDTSRPRRYIKRAAELDSFPESYAPRLLARSSRLVQPDPIVLRQLVEATAVESSEGLQNGDEPPSISINNAVLRKHFKHLTELFLKPFEPYFGIWSNHLHVAPTPYMDVTVFMKPFVATEFLKSLTTIPSTKLPTPLRTSRKKLRALYARFIASPHFQPWFAARRHDCIDAFDTVLKTLRETIDAKALMMEPSGVAMDLHGCQQLKTQIQRTIELAASQATPDARHIALMETHLHDVSAAILTLSATAS
ncbi:hypothetical protein SPRG_00632 [Saprolegnia parasitica CBS 223.65]|uniref:UDENN domain-containing protein n=1 Tax=Saprolegnia parasitica (strain CBS 223.65) TaxID=695850 RepID=A0A067CV36_SAPPC|nr:hypothetical protein SPRG_00632 [Saprolegnia parasitica CBS 223.65]KDO34569.1 hypothetical protein SPRG_00632 [Saprolegnia parasitica CBS 223.65]|eukprot:XP_012194246.1 hypothetical protein SPRG_00632 [Saprolegnia parasitica CBS 223.65]